MPATPFSCSYLILQPRFNSYFNPLFRSFTYQLSTSPLSFNGIKFTAARVHSSLSPAAETDSQSGGGGRSGALSPGPIVAGEVQRIDVNPPKGTRDFPPEEMRLRNWLFNNFKEVSRLYGFEEVDFPVLENEALFTRKAGEEIKDQLYCFEDRGNRRVALRPELTPSLARLVIQKGKSVPLPLKWFTVGQCWRYERMTRGRRREHYQWNMDIIGVPGVMVLQEVLKCYSIPESLFGKVCVIIDKIEKIPVDEVKKELMAAGVSQEAVEELLQVLSVKSLTGLEEKLGSSGKAIADLKQLFSLAEKFGYSEWIQFDASVVRGLAYYTGIVFEGFDREGKLRAICGGGRYDHLFSTFGADDIPACGFGFGDAVVVEIPLSSLLFKQLLREKGLLPDLSLQMDYIVCALDEDLQGAAAMVAHVLRKKGQSVDLVLESKPLKWVFKRAARNNAQRLVLVGSSEWQRGVVGVKILATGEQYEVKLDELI
nr:histidine--tRNA ligase, chloroplastic/mitochondrial isoform X3 [Arachis hypogaea]